MTIDLDELERLAVAAAAPPDPSGCDIGHVTMSATRPYAQYLAAVSPDVVRELIARGRAAESGRDAAHKAGWRAGLEAGLRAGVEASARAVMSDDVDSFGEHLVDVLREVKP